MNTIEMDPRSNVLGVGIDAVDMDAAVAALVRRAEGGAGGYVCVTGAHGVMEARRDPEFRRVLSGAFMTVPDGMPTVWRGQEEGYLRMGRVYGPDLMARVFAATEAAGATAAANGGAAGAGEAGECSFSHFLCGATTETLARLKARLEARFPRARICGTYAPPFRSLTEPEWDEVTNHILNSGAAFVWVGLSTPKQERFMAEFMKRVKLRPCTGQEIRNGFKCGKDYAGDDEEGVSIRNPERDTQTTAPCGAIPVLVGVGAAFDIHAGLRRDAPDWMKKAGLQWLHRLVQEPGRLWKRYVFIVPVFLALVLLQVLGAVEYRLDERPSP